MLVNAIKFIYQHNKKCVIFYLQYIKNIAKLYILINFNKLMVVLKMARITPAQFVRQVRNECKKISWANRKEVVMSTVMVFVMVAIMGFFFTS